MSKNDSSFVRSDKEKAGGGFSICNQERISDEEEVGTFDEEIEDEEEVENYDEVTDAFEI